jgi:hypothetical protein
MRLIALQEQSSETRLFLLLGSPKNDCSAIFAEVKVALSFSQLFFVDLAVKTSSWAFHFLFLPSCSGFDFSFCRRVVWERLEVGALPQSPIVNSMWLIQMPYED